MPEVLIAAILFVLFVGLAFRALSRRGRQRPEGRESLSADAPRKVTGTDLQATGGAQSRPTLAPDVKATLAPGAVLRPAAANVRPFLASPTRNDGRPRPDVRATLPPAA
jgi:hypothetical protein